MTEIPVVTPDKLPFLLNNILCIAASSWWKGGIGVFFRFFPSPSLPPEFNFPLMFSFSKDQNSSQGFECNPPSYPQWNGLGSPANSGLPFTISPAGLLSTARQLDRENKDEHILEVSNGVNPLTGFETSWRIAGWSTARPWAMCKSRNTVAQVGARLREELLLKLGLAVIVVKTLRVCCSLALWRERTWNHVQAGQEALID